MKVASSLRKAAPRKAHRERSQPAARAQLGLLEKKKDYLVRSKDYKEKRARLKKMKEKAAFRNRDEFYFAMINQKTNNGVHIKEQRAERFSVDEQALLKTQDIAYINYQRSVNLKKMERLQTIRHVHPIAAEISELKEFGLLDKEYESLDSDNEDNSNDVGKPETSIAIKKSTGKPTHVIFVDDESQVKEFNPIKHFETSANLLNQRHNRLRIVSNASNSESKKESSIFQGPTLENSADPSVHLDKKTQKQKLRLQNELAAREERELKLRRVHAEMQVQKNLMGKGAKMKIGVDSLGLPVYKWNPERKR
ncbi:UTP11-like, U3 small nucleolar ribonucleoprotein [Physocladia obscura]|uniref:UTP11-like, U3 small nucleolar ribonucleoprotein n=1 Tax=Physocladia obscura TaxID=109957 RepID=A0AAD5TAX5_9FUNG|nr:UTP11-like, U3 small nucleolar ribonucleoprotein [Physocladia obscura]